MFASTSLRFYVTKYHFRIQRAWRAYLEKKHAAENVVTPYSDLGKPDSDLGQPDSDLELQNNLDLLNTVRSSSVEEADQRDVRSKPNNTVSDQIINVRKDNFDSLESDSDLIFQNPLIDLEQGDSNVGQGQICETQQTLEKEVKPKQTELEKLPDESDHDFERRVRKHSLLKDAHRFVELKKLDSNILPFDLHKYSDFNDRNNSNSGGIAKESERFTNIETHGQEMAEILTHSNETFSSVVNNKCIMDNSAKAFYDNSDKLNVEIEAADKNDSRTNESKSHMGTRSLEKLDMSKEISESIKDELGKDKGDASKDGTKSLDLMVDSGIQIEADCDNTSDSKSSRTEDDEAIGPFEVYNIETALPNINWETLEESLKKASEEEKLRQEVGHRNE